MPTQHFIALGQEGGKTTCITHTAPARGFSISPNHSFSFFCQKCWRLFSLKSPKKEKKKWEGMFLGLAKVKYDLIMDRPNE